VIPLKDDNPTRSTPVVTILLILACIGVYFGVQSPQSSSQRSEEFTYRQAAIPCEVVTGAPLTAEEIDTGTCHRNDTAPPVFPDKNPWLAIVVSMFLHGSLMHLGGNMLFLWVFGNNIEDVRGKVRYLGFYLIAGVVATMTHILLQPSSTVPLVGASGAIAGVMGAYLVLFPRVRIRTLFIFIFIMFRDVEARWLLIIWFVSQFLIPGAGVAWTAHVGGFVFGVLAGLVWRWRRPVSAPGYAPVGYA